MDKGSSSEKSAPPLKIKDVSYGRTLNVGDYETVRIEFSAAVDPGQSYQEVLDQLKDVMDTEETIIRKEFVKR